MEPPVCVPSARGTCKSPTAAPEPEDEPPGVRLGSCGLRVGGPGVLDANSVVVVLPKEKAKRHKKSATERKYLQ